MSLAANSNRIAPFWLSQNAYFVHRHWSSICCLNICPDFWLNLPAQAPTNRLQNSYLETREAPSPFQAPFRSPTLFQAESWMRHGDPVLSIRSVLDLVTLLSFTWLSSYKSYGLRQNYKIRAQGTLINGEETSSEWETSAWGCCNWRGRRNSLVRLTQPFSSLFPSCVTVLWFWYLWFIVLGFHVILSLNTQVRGKYSTLVFI